MYFLAERGERRPDGRQALLAYAVGCNPDTDPFDDWWHLAGRELGGDDFAEYFDPKDGLFTRLQHSADDLVLSATATHLSQQWCLPPDAATASQPRIGGLCSHRRHRRACAFVSSRRGTPRRPQRRHATGDNRMNTPSTSPRLHLLPVSLRTANAFVLSHHRHHRPVQGAKFALAVTLSDSDLIHGVAIVGRPVARHLDAGSHAAVHRRHTQRLQQALRRGLAGGKGAGLHTPAHLHHARRRWRQPARRRLAADRRARWRRLEPSRPSARRYPEHLRGAKCL